MDKYPYSEHSSHFDDIMRMLHIENVREAAESLLIGNDTQCFTTQQFKERYISKCNERWKASRSNYTSRLYPLTVDYMDQLHGQKEGWGRSMLKKTNMYYEIKPDVWITMASFTSNA